MKSLRIGVLGQERSPKQEPKKIDLNKLIPKHPEQIVEECEEQRYADY